MWFNITKPEKQQIINVIRMYPEHIKSTFNQWANERAVLLPPDTEAATVFQWCSSDLSLQCLFQAKSRLNDVRALLERRWKLNHVPTSSFFIASFQNKRMTSSWLQLELMKRHITESSEPGMDVCCRKARRQWTFVGVFVQREPQSSVINKSLRDENWIVETTLPSLACVQTSYLSSLALAPAGSVSIPPTEPSAPGKAASTGSAQNYFIRLFVDSRLQAPVEPIG